MVKFKATDGYKPELLIQFARDHLSAADVLYQAETPCLDSAGYLAHLTLELLLKAYLLCLSGAFPDSHNLPDLYSQIRLLDPGFEIEQSYFEALKAFNQQYRLRYPHPGTTPSVAKGDQPVLHHLVDAIVEQFPADLRQVTGSVRAAKKGHRSIIRGKGDVHA